MQKRILLSSTLARALSHSLHRQEQVDVIKKWHSPHSKCSTTTNSFSPSLLTDMTTPTMRERSLMWKHARMRERKIFQLPNILTRIVRTIFSKRVVMLYRQGILDQTCLILSLHLRNK